jgi:hypothetical protein
MALRIRERDYIGGEARFERKRPRTAPPTGTAPRKVDDALTEHEFVGRGPDTEALSDRGMCRKFRGVDQDGPVSPAAQRREHTAGMIVRWVRDDENHLAV